MATKDQAMEEMQSMIIKLCDNYIALVCSEPGGDDDKPVIYFDDLLRADLLAWRDRAVEDSITKIVGTWSEAIMHNGKVFIKEEPFMQTIVDLIGDEKFKAIQATLINKTTCNCDCHKRQGTAQDNHCSLC